MNSGKNFANNEADNKRAKLDQVVADSPTLLGATDRTNTRFEPLKESQIMAPGYPDGSHLSRSAALSSLPSQDGADASTSKKINKRSSNKRTRVDDGSDSDAKENLQGPNADSRKRARQSKRVKPTPEYNDDDSDEGGRRIRKTSKLNAKIAAGKGPQRGSLAPNGEVRPNEEGQMEFRDMNNPEWSKYIHN